ncbi:MAG TPA: hypothetical protein VEP73_03740 [Actinomycetota bacterium]|nr:hypothetical protein [Actinomycetota bacterium]
MRARDDGIGGLLPAARPWWGYLWAAPNSLVGLVGAASSGGRPVRWRGVLLCEGGRAGLARFLAWRGFCAITLGHVIVASEPLDDHLLAHELGHVRQHERWGPLFYPAYLLASLAGYRRNPFERAAERRAVHALAHQAGPAAHSPGEPGDRPGVGRA